MSALGLYDALCAGEKGENVGAWAEGDRSKSGDGANHITGSRQ